MTLLGSTNEKKTKHNNGENVAYLEITKVVWVRFNIVNNDCQKNYIISSWIFNTWMWNIQKIRKNNYQSKLRLFADSKTNL